MAHEEHESWDDLVAEVLSDPDARAAYAENEIRRKMGAAIDKARQEQGLSMRDLASLIRTSVSQVQRLLHRDLGGSLTLKTVCRAADALGLQVRVHIHEKPRDGSSVVDFGTSAWTPVRDIVPDPRAVTAAFRGQTISLVAGMS